jgi:hypothetical protein
MADVTTWTQTIATIVTSLGGIGASCLWLTRALDRRIAVRVDLAEQRLGDRIDHVERTLTDRIDSLDRLCDTRLGSVEADTHLIKQHLLGQSVG